MKRTVAILTLAIILTTAACVVSGESRAPAPGDILFEDDFSSSASGWEVIELPVGSAGYGEGYYFVVGKEMGINMYGAAQQDFSDLTIDVDATQIAGPDNNSYGLICRLQVNDSGYYFFISGDGFYSLFTVSDVYNPLIDWTASSVIQQGQATNHILVGCVGDHLTMAVNGEPLIDVHDGTYTGGNIGLIATTYEQGTSTEIHYDNVIVRRP